MRRALAIALPLAALLAGCPQARMADMPALQNVDSSKLAVALQPTPNASASPSPKPSVIPPREIMPFQTGDRFEYALRYYLGGFLGVPVGTLAIEIDRVEVADGVETIDLRLLPPFSAPEAHRVVLKDGMFHYDDKPFVPTHMRPGDSWPAQDGIASVVGRETVDVPAGQFPYCYRVYFLDPHTGEQLTLWFAPGVGLAKGDFNL
ncbi:MAG TPA: hypothetical protein V6D05_08125, partial [Stenomitos sp.]